MPNDSRSSEKKAVALGTIFMSVPLLLSFNIKYQWFPEGVGYLLLFYWGLLSVFVVPILLAIGITLRIVYSKTSDGSALKWGLWGVVVGLVAEMVFIAARYSPPTL
jgi:hypothetical protein